MVTDPSLRFASAGVTHRVLGGLSLVTTERVDPVDISDDEQLAELALAADPDTVAGPDAVSIWEVAGQCPQPLPSWYMPAPMGGGVRGWRRRVARFNVGLIVLSFLVINACGLCNTYGQLHF